MQELLSEYDKLSLEDRADIYTAIRDLYREHVLSKKSIQFIRLFAEGYSVEEVSAMYPKDSVSSVLSAACEAVAERTGNTDEKLFQRILRRYPKFRKNSRAFKNLLDKAHFITYTVLDTETA
jgi:hypothetical protein